MNSPALSALQQPSGAALCCQLELAASLGRFIATRKCLSSGIEMSRFLLAAAWARFAVLKQWGFLFVKSERH